MKYPHSRTWRVVVALDFSSPSLEALDEALRWIRARPWSELHAVHVAEDTYSVTNTARLRHDDEVLEHIPDRLRAVVAARARAFEGELPPSFVGFHVRLGSVVPALLQMTVDVDADLLVVGTHGRTGFSRAVMGSVAEALVRQARCPVLVARRKEYRDLARTEGIEPACPDCLAVRRADPGGSRWWCDLHARPHDAPHMYSSAGPSWTLGGMADFHGFD